MPSGVSESDGPREGMTVDSTLLDVQYTVHSTSVRSTNDLISPVIHWQVTIQLDSEVT